VRDARQERGPQEDVLGGWLPENRVKRRLWILAALGLFLAHRLWDDWEEGFAGSLLQAGLPCPRDHGAGRWVSASLLGLCRLQGCRKSFWKAGAGCILCGVVRPWKVGTSRICFAGCAFSEGSGCAAVVVEAGDSKGQANGKAV
jgi:hypothetical protein